MNSKLCFLCFIALIIITSLSCTTVPTTRVGQPWIRALTSSESLPLGAKIKIDVYGSTKPLLGNEELTTEKVKNKAIYLFKRRGYIIDSSTYDYAVQIYYKTERQDKLQVSSSSYLSKHDDIAFATNSISGATSGLGVSIARAVGAISSKTTYASDFLAVESVSYIHTIAVEVRNKSEKVIWKGESTWDSKNLNLISRILAAFQLIISDLPYDKSIKPEVNRIKESHALKFYRLEIDGKWFTCPALPYRVWFEKPGYTTYTKNNVPKIIKDSYALSAYLDLLQTAEYVLPCGNDKDWENPLNVDLWKSVMLGGQYIIGPDRRQINVLIKITGKSEGYYVKKCWVATDSEYVEFQQKFSRWQKVLTDYYDVFEK